MKQMKETTSRESRAQHGQYADMQVPGTSLSVAEVSAILADRRSCEELFRWFPTLDPNDLRDAVEWGVSESARPCPALVSSDVERQEGGSRQERGREPPGSSADNLAAAKAFIR